MKTIVTLGVLAAAASVASADTLNLGAGTNAGTRGVLFNLTNTTGNDVQIDSFDMFVWFGSSAPSTYNLPLEVYSVSGGWSGHEGVIGDWTLMGSETLAVSGPTGTSHNVNIGGLTLGAGETYGIAFVTTGSVSSSSAAVQGHNDGIVGQTFSDANLTATAGATVINAATLGITTHSSNYNKSMVAGNINYTVVPAPGAMALLGLGGLAAVRRRR